MISIKTAKEIEYMRYAGKVTANLLKTLKENIKIGVTPKQLEKISDKFIKTNNCESNFKGHNGFPATICVSVNEQLIHTIPSDVKFKDGDIVSIDAGCSYKGYHSDAAFTMIVGSAKSEIHTKLVKVSEIALNEAIRLVKNNVRIGTISNMIQTIVEKENFFLPKYYSGHGIGTQLHEQPFIPNVGKKDTGLRLKTAMVICIEPMVQIGTDKTKVLSDNWTVVSQDNSYSAHFEHSVLVTETGYEILTLVEE